MFKSFRIGLLILLVAAGCSSSMQLTPGPSLSTATISVHTMPASDTPEPTRPAVSPTKKSTQTAIFTPVPVFASNTSEPGLLPITIEILNAAPKVPTFDGTLALAYFPNSNNPGYHLLNLTTNSLSKIDSPSSEALFCWSVSPNRDQLACWTKDQLIILDNKGQVLTSAPRQKDWYAFLGWLDKNRVLVMKAATPLAPTIIYDPYKKVRQEIAQDYPEGDPYNSFDQIGYFAGTDAFYDPTLNLVVYQAGATTVLLDRNKKQILAQVPRGENNPYPQWSPDGQQVIIAGRANYPEAISSDNNDPMDVYRVSRSGDVQRITNFSRYFPHDNSMIYSLSWSPDGKQIAFFYYSENSTCSSGCLMVVDVENSELKVFQFPNGYHIEPAGTPTYTLTWSPDGRGILLKVHQDGDPETPILMIFDIDKQTAYPVAKDANILGWMTVNP
jgi:WD40 repeat protein